MAARCIRGFERGAEVTRLSARVGYSALWPSQGGSEAFLVFCPGYRHRWSGSRLAAGCTEAQQSEQGGRTTADVEPVPAGGVCRTQLPNRPPDPVQTSRSTFASGLSQGLVKQSGCKTRGRSAVRARLVDAVRVPQRCTEYSCVGRVFLAKALPREGRQPVLPGARSRSVGESPLAPIDSVTFLFFFGCFFSNSCL